MSSDFSGTTSDPRLGCAKCYMYIISRSRVWQHIVTESCAVLKFYCIKILRNIKKCTQNQYKVLAYLGSLLLRCFLQLKPVKLNFEVKLEALNCADITISLIQFGFWLIYILLAYVISTLCVWALGCLVRVFRM